MDWLFHVCRNCTKQLVGFHQMAAKVGELSGIYSKFASPGRDSVALLPPAKTVLAFSMNSKNNCV